MFNSFGQGGGQGREAEGPISRQEFAFYADREREGGGEQLQFFGRFQGIEAYQEPGRQQQQHPPPPWEVNDLSNGGAQQATGAGWYAPIPGGHPFLQSPYGMVQIASTGQAGGLSVDTDGWTQSPPVSAHGFGASDDHGQEPTLHSRRTGASSTQPRVDVLTEGPSDRALSTAALKFVDEYLNFPASATTPVHPISTAKDAASPAKPPQEGVQWPPERTIELERERVQRALLETTEKFRGDLLGVLRGSLDQLPRSVLTDVNTLLVTAGRVKDHLSSLLAATQPGQSIQVESTPSEISSGLVHTSDVGETTPDSPPDLDGLDGLPQERYFRGGWKPAEVARLCRLVEQSSNTFSPMGTSGSSQGGLMPNGFPMVDWGWVCGEMAGLRSRHQVLCKAVELGLRKSETRRGAKKKRLEQ